MKVILATARCCKDWTVAIGTWRIGPCGLCGEVPVVDPDQTIEQIDIPDELVYTPTVNRDIVTVSDYRDRYQGDPGTPSGNV